MNLKEAIVNVVNSAIVTFENHNQDNSFLEGKIVPMEKELQHSGYVPVGICFNVPWNRYDDEQIAFVYEFEEEKCWCHMSRLNWEFLICDAYGYNNADQIIESVLKYTQEV